MKKLLKSFQQQLWHKQYNIKIYTDCTITVDDEYLTQREQALAYIILRLNASSKGWKQDYLSLKEENEKLKAKISKKSP